MSKQGTITVATVAFALAVAGCAAMREDAAHKKENLLAAAGFKMKLADTPEKLARAEAMPQLKMVARSGPLGQLGYTYADVKGCQCVYTGDAKNYAEYKRLALQRDAAEAQLEAAEANEAAAMDWGWWGPW
jgi:hypothetical protein